MKRTLWYLDRVGRRFGNIRRCRKIGLRRNELCEQHNGGERVDNFHGLVWVHDFLTPAGGGLTTGAADLGAAAAGLTGAFF